MEIIAAGKAATMPEKMMSEEPLPMPREVICSPSHIRNNVPPVSVIVVDSVKKMPGIGDNAGLPLQADGDAISLERGQHNGEETGRLVDDLAPGLALFLQRFERGKNARQKLNDDRGGDIGHDVQGEDRHALHSAAREHVEELQDALAVAVEEGAKASGSIPGSGI